MGVEHYDLTAEELDFTINYDIKYRMGDELRKTTSHQIPLFLSLAEGEKI